jgi:hypothetical protein
MAPPLTRREAFGGAAAGVLLASCGGDPAPRRGPEAGSGAALLGSLVALQHAAVAAYGACEEVLSGDLLRHARGIREQEREHAGRLGVLVRGLAGDPPAGRADEEYARTFPRLRGADDALRFADHLEQRQVRAYLDALTDLPGAGDRTSVADICASQGTHLASVRVLRGLPAAEGPFVTGAL